MITREDRQETAENELYRATCELIKKNPGQPARVYCEQTGMTLKSFYYRRSEALRFGRPVPELKFKHSNRGIQTGPRKSAPFVVRTAPRDEVPTKATEKKMVMMLGTPDQIREFIRGGDL